MKSERRDAVAEATMKKLLLTWLIGALGVILNLLAPSTEESLLEEKFGEPYLENRMRVPRFVV